MFTAIAWIIGLFFFFIFCSAFAKAQENYEEEKNSRRRKNPKVKLAKIADIKRNQPGLEMLINYYAGRNRHWQTGPIDWKTKVYGLAGKGGGFVIGYSHELGRIRHFSVGSIHNCVDAETGEIITDIKARIKAFNPVPYDMDDYFEKLEQYKEKSPDKAREWLNVD